MIVIIANRKNLIIFLFVLINRYKIYLFSTLRIILIWKNKNRDRLKNVSSTYIKVIIYVLLYT